MEPFEPRLHLGFAALCDALRDHLYGKVTTTAAGDVGRALAVVLSETLDTSELASLRPTCKDRLIKGFDEAF